MTRGQLPGLLCVLLAEALLAACSATAPSATTSTATPSTSPSAGPTPEFRVASIVALGDSVPRGTNCDCRPYPDLTGDQLSAAAGRTVPATNDSVAGSTTDGVLGQLTSQQDVMADVGPADVVEIEVGANDVAHSPGCGTSLDCYTPDLPQLEKNLTAIVARVHDLTAGHPVLVVLLDYWSVWLGGAYAAEQGQAYVATAQELTDQVNGAIRSVATASGSAYVDLRAAFKGPDYSYDETHYLSDDGDHPNAAGHQQIATAAVGVIESALQP